MANEIYIGPQVVFGNQDVAISATTISTTNTANIIKVDETGYKSYNPNDGSIPQFTVIEEDAGYIYNSKTAQNLPAFFKLGGTAVVTPAYVVNDTFTGAAGNLTGHTPDVGSAPLKGWGATGNLWLVGDGTMTSTAAAGEISRYAYPNAASGANQKVTARIKFTGPSGGSTDTQLVVLSLRSDTTTSDITGYILIISGADISGGPGRFRLTIAAVNNGVQGTPLATLADVPAMIDGSNHTVSFEATGTGFIAKVDGTSVLTATDSANTLPGGTTQRKGSISTLGQSAPYAWVYDSYTFENI